MEQVVHTGVDAPVGVHVERSAGAWRRGHRENRDDERGGAMKLGREHTMAWSAVQDRFGVIPEEFDYRAFKAVAPSNSLRPELAAM